MKKKFLEAQQIEDALSALKNGYYDTHDLEYISEHEDEYHKKLKELKKSF